VPRGGRPRDKVHAIEPRQSTCGRDPDIAISRLGYQARCVDDAVLRARECDHIVKFDGMDRDCNPLQGGKAGTACRDKPIAARATDIAPSWSSTRRLNLETIESVLQVELYCRRTSELRVQPTYHWREDN